ncbi:MAG: AI-2E family transporter [Dehalococcoidia bacterium]
MSANGNVFKRNRNLIFFLIGLVIIFFILYALRSAIFPFLLGLVVVYLVHPLIVLVENKLPFKDRYGKPKRIILILLFFIIVVAFIGLFTFYLISEISDSFVHLFENTSTYITGAWQTIQNWIDSLRYGIPEGWQVEMDKVIAEFGTKASDVLRQGAINSLEFIPTTVNFVLAFISLPIFLFFILKDSKQLKEGFYSYLTPGVEVHTRNVFSIIDKVMGRYIRAQLLLGLVVAVLVFIGLSILRIRLAVPLAVIAGITELIPILGPWIGGFAGVLVTLATVPDKVIWVAIVYLAVQQLENLLLVPRIQGGYLHINPAILMVLIVLGSYLAGIWGIILIAPVTATIVEIYKYVRDSTMKSQLDVPSQNEQGDMTTG